MLLSEEERVETALLRYAQQKAATWGAKQFAAEFERRELEERWLEAAASQTTPYSPTAAPEPAPMDMLSGPVDAASQEGVVGPDRAELRFLRPKYERHSSVPRPPSSDPEPGGRRGRRRRKRDRSSHEQGWTVSAAEAARMSPAARRLYGLDDPAPRDR